RQLLVGFRKIWIDDFGGGGGAGKIRLSGARFGPAGGSKQCERGKEPRSAKAHESTPGRMEWVSNSCVFILHRSTTFRQSGIKSSRSLLPHQIEEFLRVAEL